MPKWMTAIIACYLTLNLFAAQAQSVDDVVSKYEDALGGREKLNNIQSVYMEGVSVAQNGNEITSKMTKVNKKLMRTEINFGMGSFAMLVTDKAGWMKNPRNGGNFEPMGAERVTALQPELDCAGPLVNYAAKGHIAELLGKENVDGTELFKIRLTLNTGSVITYYIDPATYYVRREVRKGGGMGRRGGQGGQGGNNAEAEVVTEFADYQKTTDGFVFPFSVKRSGMGGSTTYEKIEVNHPVDPSLFEPK
ncbi:hypothetical protein [Flavihumibacter solisilvae]|uniref:Uncharacterized protein n=1 Tax=Flavihumibacter solisilvae TaxID=1349421 RepID=A0A0C1L5A7_9BACT|nr:hypothetical protein [Flavihumibacter solisilvae]KIC95297.1 hypothetical protein OI18_06720 [Flavihumibacter solisilvae]